METASAWDWLRQRFEHGLGQQLNDASILIPAPVWFEEGQRVGVGMRWYGVVVTYPRRPDIRSAGFIPPLLRPLAGAADDLLAIRNPGDLAGITDRLWVEQLQAFGLGGGTVVMPSFFGADP